MVTQNPPSSYSFSQRLGIFGRCVSNACPRCSQRPIAGLFSFKTTCPHCGWLIDKGNGFLLGALPVSYAIFVLFWLIPMLLAWILHYLSYELSFLLIGLGAIVWPVLLHNYCKMVSLGTYYFFMIRELHEAKES